MKQLWVLFFLFIIATSAFSNEIENKVFDENRTTAQKILREEYRKSKVLFIGFYHHYSHQHIEQLTSLLKEVGNDPNLKTIVLERSSDVSKFYEILSTKELDDSIKEFKFSSIEDQTQALCRGPGEWAYVIKNFFPKLRKINNQRKQNPILVKSVDGIQSFMKDELWPGLNRTMRDGTCPASTLTTSDGITLTMYGNSGTREQHTANNFKNQIWNTLGPKDKAIVLYHRAHLTDGLDVCRADMVDENNWIANIGNFSWYGRFLNNTPGAKKDIRLVFIDEKFDSNHEMITFNITKRQSKRLPDQDWAINLDALGNILDEKGFQMFTPESDIRRAFYNDYARGNNTLTDIADGLIFNARAHENYRNSKSSDYLPEYCPVEDLDSI